MFDSQKIADTYDQIGLNFSATRQKLSPEVISLLPKLPENASVLDLGCGNGVLLTALPKTITYTGLDFSRAMIDEARSRFAGPNAEFIISDILDQSVWDGLGPLPAGRQEFDFIAALAVFHHLPTNKDHEVVLSQINRHLKPGSACLISVWRLNQPKFDRFRTNPNHLSIPFHGGPSRDFYSFTDNELTKLAEQAGFSDIKTKVIKDNLYLKLA